MKDERKLKLTFLLIDRDVSKKIIKYLDDKGFNKYFSFYGKGSASSTILEYLGIGEIEKNILVYPSGEEDGVKLMDHIRASGNLKEIIAFRIPVKGISSLNGLNYYLGGNSNE